MALQTKANPITLDLDQVLDYLLHCKNQHKTPSGEFFQAYCLWLANGICLNDMDGSRVSLPQIKRSKKTPCSLVKSGGEAIDCYTKTIEAPDYISALYDCGLRCAELCNIKLTDICFDRSQLHIKQGKGGKDRYVPISSNMLRGLRKYIQVEAPVTWLFNSNRANGSKVPYTSRGVQWVVKEAKRRSGIQKQVTTHVLRHTYATHLLEMGTNIMVLKDLLGHANVQTTMVYLHIAQLENHKRFAPLDVPTQRADR